MKTVYPMPSSAPAEAAADDAAETLASTTLRPAPSPARRSQAQPLPMPAPRTAFVPLLLCGLALLGWLAFQGTLLWRDHQALAATHAGQQQTVDNASKLRGSLDALAADTQRMADAGNPNARLLVEELRKRGVTINPAATPATPAAAPPAATATPTR